MADTTEKGFSPFFLCVKCDRGERFRRVVFSAAKKSSRNTSMRSLRVLTRVNECVGATWRNINNFKARIFHGCVGCYVVVQAGSSNSPASIKHFQLKF